MNDDNAPQLQQQRRVDNTQPKIVGNLTPQFTEEITEIRELEDKVLKSPLPQALKDKSQKMIKRLYRMAKFGSYSGEYELIDRYVSWIMSIPWGTYTQDVLDTKHAEQILTENHYGLKDVKERVLEFLAVSQLNPSYSAAPKQVSGESEYEQMVRLKSQSDYRSLILSFVGIQGIGKTSMAKSIAQALGRKFVRISLGAMASVTELRGQSRAFLDAEPGQIIKGLVRTRTMNPVILLDEIDKISAEGGRRADINATLLEILDPEQNTSFVDSYIDYPIDLSRVLFITTANSLSTLSAALLDRLEIIRFSSYSDEEKQMIGRDYLLPKVIKACGLKEGQLQISESVWPLVIRPLGFDAGVRQLERNLLTIARKVTRKVVNREGDRFIITPQNVREFLPADIGVYT